MSNVLMARTTTTEDPDELRFRVTHLCLSAPEGVPLIWQGRRLDSGPLTIDLDDEPDSTGVMDYSNRHAAAEFHVRLSFPRFAQMLDDAGVNSELTRPLRGLLRSEGEILDDHSLALSGECRLQPHALFPQEETSAAVLPGY